MLMTRHFDYCPSASKGDNLSVRSSAPVVSRCFPGGYNVKLYISRGMVSMVVTGFFAQCRMHIYQRELQLCFFCACENQVLYSSGFSLNEQNVSFFHKCICIYDYAHIYPCFVTIQYVINIYN